MSEAAADAVVTKVDLALRRLEELSREAGMASSTRGLIGDALEELATTLEELRAAGEDLAESNSELRRAQGDLREGRRAYQELFDFAPDGYLITNPYGTIRMANLAAARLLTAGRPELLAGKPLTVFVAQDHRTAFFVALERVRRTGASVDWDGWLTPRGGPSFPARIAVAGRPDGDREAVELLWLLHDLSERERFERALRASEEAFRALAENSPDPIGRLGPDLRFEYANAATERATGRRLDEILGSGAERIGLAPEGAAAWAAACARALEGVEQTVELPYDTPSGPRWLESRIVPERRAGRAVDRLLVVSRDVTDRRSAEQALRESDDLKSAMLASVSHELRTPLTAIAAAADALAAAEGPASPELLELITGETTRLERMVANLLDLSRLQGSAMVPHLEIYPVDTVVGTALEAVAGIIGDAPVSLDLSEDAPLVMVDPLMCERILVNLLHNAVTHGAPPIRLVSRAQDGHVELAVADAGPGVPSGEERRIFEPFIHGDAPGSAGIGLALAQALAEAQGARLELRPGTQPGACFVLTLPGATIAAGPESGDRAAAPVATGP